MFPDKFYVTFTRRSFPDQFQKDPDCIPAEHDHGGNLQSGFSSMVYRKGLDPSTGRLWADCSIQLS